MVTARSVVVSWLGQRQSEAHTVESPADMPCDRIDTQSRRRHFLRRDTSLNSTRCPWVHRTDRGCVRTCWFPDSPLRIPFQLHSTSDAAPSAVPARLGVVGYVVSTHCISLSKHAVALTRFFPMLCSQETEIANLRMSTGGWPRPHFDVCFAHQDWPLVSAA